MKKIFFGFVAAAMLVACQSQEKGFTLSGKLENATDKTIVVNAYNKDGVKTLDTLKIVDGVINYSTVLEEPLYVMIGEAKSRNFARFFAINSTYTINGSVDKMNEAVVTGGEVYQSYKTIADAQKETRKKSGELRKAYGEASQAGDTAKQKQIVEEFEAGEKAMEDIVTTFIKNNPTSPVAAFLAMDVYQGKPFEEMKEGLAQLDASLATSTYYQALSEKIEKLEKVSIGQIAPDFTMNDRDGNPVKLSDLRGKLLLVDFWASWCGPCRAENPHVVKIYNEFKDKGFDVLGVSLDQKKDAWLKAIEDDKLTWNHVSDLKGWKNEAAKLYAVSGIPHTVLLDKDGKILAKNLRGDALRDKVAEVLGE